MQCEEQTQSICTDDFQFNIYHFSSNALEKTVDSVFGVTLGRGGNFLSCCGQRMCHSINLITILNLQSAYLQQFLNIISKM